MPPSHQTGFGGHRSNSFDLGSGLGPPVNKHRNRLSALGRLFKPWKWKRRKKSEKFEKTSKCKLKEKLKKPAQISPCQCLEFVSKNKIGVPKICELFDVLKALFKNARRCIIFGPRHYMH